MVGFDVNKLNLNRFAKGTNDLKELKNMDDICHLFVYQPKNLDTLILIL